MKPNTDFKKDFSTLDALIYMTPADVAAVIAAPSVGSVYTQLHRGELPEPMIRENRRMRWTVGQIREHLSDQVEAFKLAQAVRLGAGGMPMKRPGRARKPTILTAQNIKVTA